MKDLEEIQLNIFGGRKDTCNKERKQKGKEKFKIIK